MTQITIKLPPDLAARVSEATADPYMPPDEWIIGAVTAYLDWQDAEKRIAEAMEGAA